METPFLRRHSSPPTGLPPVQPCDFIAIDFETANSTRGSACAVGVVVVRDGAVVAEGASRIDPEQSFDSYNIWIHGIDEDAVRGAPTFEAIWPELAALLDGRVVAAHNSSFDISVLRNSALNYGIAGGAAFDLFCTYRLATKVFPLLPSFSLGYLAPKLGIEFIHHDAAEDARACAEVALIMCREKQAASLAELASEVGSIPGRVEDDRYEPFHSERLWKNLASREGREDADPNHPLFGKSICFTGTLASMRRQDAVEKVAEVGCDFLRDVSKKLDYLVIGDGDFVRFSQGWETTKLKRAMEPREQGASIEIIPERQFMELLMS